MDGNGNGNGKKGRGGVDVEWMWMRPLQRRHRNRDCRTLSNLSAAGSSPLRRPFSSKRGGSSMVESVSEPGESARRWRLRSRPEPWEPLERSSTWRRLWWFLSRSLSLSESRRPLSESLSSLRSPCRSRFSSERSGEGLGDISCSCGLRSNFTPFSRALTGLGASGGESSRVWFRPAAQSVRSSAAWVGLNPPRVEAGVTCSVPDFLGAGALTFSSPRRAW